MTAEMFQVIHENAVSIIELKLPDTLDSTEFNQLNDSLSRLCADSNVKRWVLDLSHVTYMGSSTLGLLVNLRQQIRVRKGHLVICSLSPRMLGIFHACCLERLFTIVKTRDDARRELKYAG